MLLSIAFNGNITYTAFFEQLMMYMSTLKLTSFVFF